MIDQPVFKVIVLLQALLFLAGCSVQIREEGIFISLPTPLATTTPPLDTLPANLIDTLEAMIPAETASEAAAIAVQSAPSMNVEVISTALLEPKVGAVQVSTDHAEATSSLAPSVAGDFADLQTELLAQIETATLTTTYQKEAIAFADHLLAHLHEFQLAHLGITTEQIKGVLARDGSGARINAVVQEVWGEWTILSQQQNFDRQMTVPTLDQHGLSPFRRLVIRLIQNRQGVLSDSEQHALYGFFARYEPSDSWRNDMDSIIGAINRESFLWFYGE